MEQMETTTVTPTSPVEFLYKHWLGLLAILFLLLQFGDYFIVGGIPVASDVRLVAAKVFNFTLPIGVISLLRFHSRNVTQQRRQWYLSAITIASATLTFLYSFAVGTINPLYIDIYKLFSIELWASVLSFTAIAWFIIASRGCVMRNKTAAWLAFWVIIGLIWNSAWSDLIHPGLKPMFNWWSANIINATEEVCTGALDTPLYVAASYVMILGYLTLRRRVVAGGGE
jgi:hypothetical protein